MAQEETEISALFADFSRRLTDLEEHLRLVKERLLVVGRTLLMQSEKLNKELVNLKENFRGLKDEIDRLREGLEHVIKESAEFVRKEELAALERYIKMFEPMRFVTEEDVKRLIERQRKK